MNTRIVEQELELELKKIEQLKKAMDIGFLLGQGKTAEEISPASPAGEGGLIEKEKRFNPCRRGCCC